MKKFSFSLFSFLLFSSFSAFAQNPTLIWQNDAPKQFSNDLVALGDTGYLYINAQVIGTALAQPKIEIKLPKGVDFIGNNYTTLLISETGVTTSSSCFSAPTLTGTEAAGNRTLVMNYTCNTNSLPIGDSIVLKVKIRATCNMDVLNPGNFTVTITSGAGGTVNNNFPPFLANLIKPTLRIIPNPNVVNYASISETKLVNIDIDAWQGYSFSTLVTLTYDGSVVTINDFKIDGISLTTLASNAGIGVYHQNRTSATATTYIRLNQSVLNGPINNIVRKLTFTANSKYGCTQTIGTKIQNTLTTVCDSWTGANVILQLPTENVLPLYTVVSGYQTNDDLVNPDPNAGKHIYNCWNGEDPIYWVKNTITNTNNTSTASFKFTTTLTNHQTGNSGHVDTTQVYYCVTVRNAANTADSIVTNRTRIPGGYITVASVYSNTTTHAPELIGKYRGMTINLPFSAANPAPPGAKIEVIYPVYGKADWLYDPPRAGTTPSITYRPGSSMQSFYTRQQNFIATNTCNKEFNLGISEDYPFNRDMPRFTTLLESPYSVYPLTPAILSNSIVTGNMNTAATPTGDDLLTGQRYAEVFVKMPAWLTLNPFNPADPITSAFNIDGTLPTPNSGIFYGTADGYKTYSVQYHGGSISGLFNVRVIPDDCPDVDCPKNLVDNIIFWTDWVSGTPETDCRPRFKKTTKIWTTVTLFCEQPAVKVVNAGAYRITRGLKDSGNNHIPDDGVTAALDNEMNHYMFQQNDTGYYYLQSVLGGSADVQYTRLNTVWNYYPNSALTAGAQYTWGTSTNINNGNTRPIREQATVEIKRWTSPTTFTLYTFPLTIPTTIANTQNFLEAYYDGITNGYLPQGGDSCFFKIPFYCRQGLTNALSANRYGGISVTTSAQQIPVFISPDDDDDDTPVDTCIYGIANSDEFRVFFRGVAYTGMGTTPVTFNSPCTSMDINQLGTYSYFSENWINEVRYVDKLDSIVICVPTGFVRNTNTISLQTSRYGGNSNYTSRIDVIPDRAIANAAGDSIFTIYLAQYIDYNFNDTHGSLIATGLIPPDGKKLIPGEDGIAIRCYFSLYATPAAAAGSEIYVTGTVHLTNISLGNRTTNTTSIRLQYLGTKSLLAVSPKTMLINAEQLLLQSVELMNPHGTETNKNVWLFVEGNVENAYLIHNVTKDTLVTGVGLNNCWLEIGDMAPASSEFYRLIFTYKGKTECSNDRVNVYPVLDTEKKGWNPDITCGIECVPLCNRGQVQTTVLDIINSRPKIAGHIAPDIPGGRLSHNVPYTMDYFINGKVSQGALNGPYIVIRVPAGQVYTDTTAAYGVATFVYPEGSAPREIPQEIRDRLKLSIGEDSDDSQPRMDTIWVKELLEADNISMLPGWGADPYFGYTDAQRIVNIHLPFIPTCQTELTGIRFRANFFGSKTCDAPCEDNGLQYITPTIYTDIEVGYSFEVGLQNKDMNNRTFTPHHTEDTLKATFHKLYGDLGVPLGPNDFVRVRLPEDFTIDGTVECPQFGTIAIIGNPLGDVTSEGRIYKLYLPVTELNALIMTYQDTMTFEYYIPVLYTPNPDGTCNTPKQELECQVDVVTPEAFGEDCDPRPVTIGVDNLYVLNLNFDGLMFPICKSIAADITIDCYGVTLEWYKNEDATGTPFHIGNVFTYTPTVHKDTVFYIRAFYDYYGSEKEDFGVAPVYVTLFPEVIANLKADTVCAGNATSFINLSTVGGDPSDLTNTKKWYWYLDGSTVPFDSVRDPMKTLTAGNHNVKLKVISEDGCSDEKTIPVLVRPLPVPTISGSLDKCFEECTVYRTQTGMTDYHWTVKNGTIQGINNEDSVKVCWDQMHFPEYGYIKVVYSNNFGCTAAGLDSLQVLIRQTPVVAVISGKNNPCINTVETYSLVPQPGIIIDNYIWKVTGGGTVVGGGGTSNNYITIRWDDSGAQKLSLFVSGPACSAPDTGYLPVNVMEISPPSIIGVKKLCIEIGETESDPYIYSTAAGKSNYAWHIVGGYITSGGTTNEVEVIWNTVGTGKLAVSYTDGGCPTFMKDTFEVAITNCAPVLLHCIAMKAVTRTAEVLYIASDYTHSDDSWDAILMPLPPPATVDSVYYFYNSLTVKYTLDGATFPVGPTTVTVIAFYETFTDTCEFTVNISRACPTYAYDCQGNYYKVTSLGGFCWTENIRATNYSLDDYDEVLLVGNCGAEIVWAKPYYSAEYPNTVFNKATFGLLYTWYSTVGLSEDGAGTPFNEVGDFIQGICPYGYHLPMRDVEWESLVQLNLLTPDPVKELKSKFYWLAPGTDNYGWDARPAGWHNGELNRFVDLYGKTGWWAAENKTDYFYIGYYFQTLNCGEEFSPNALSVRCVLDY